MGLRFTTCLSVALWSVWLTISSGCTGSSFRGGVQQVKSARTASPARPSEGDASAVEPTPLPVTVPSSIPEDTGTSWQETPVPTVSPTPAPDVTAEPTPSPAPSTPQPTATPSPVPTPEDGPKPTMFDVIFVVDRTGRDGTQAGLWQSIAVIQQKSTALASKISALGKSIRFSIIDYRFAPILEWHVPFTADAGVFSSRMLGSDKNPLDQMLVIDPDANWVDNLDHWLYYDATYSNRSDTAGQWALDEALVRIKADAQAAPLRASAEKILVLLTDAVSYAGKTPGSHAIAALAQKMSADRAAGLHLRLVGIAPEAHGNLYGGLTPKAQLGQLGNAVAGMPYSALSFPLTETSFLNDFVGAIGAQGP